MIWIKPFSMLEFRLLGRFPRVKIRLGVALLSALVRAEAPFRRTLLARLLMGGVVFAGRLLAVRWGGERSHLNLGFLN